MVLVVWRTWERGWGVSFSRGEVTDLRKEALVWRVPRTWTEETPTGKVELRSNYNVTNNLEKKYVKNVEVGGYHVEKTRAFSSETFLFSDCSFSFGIHGDVFGGSRLTSGSCSVQDLCMRAIEMIGAGLSVHRLR